MPSQVLSLSRLEGRLLSLWLCTRTGTALQVCGDAPRTGRAPLGWPNRTHAYDSAACHLSCLGMGGVAQFVPLPDGRAWEAGGRRARSRSPRFGQISASGIGVSTRLKPRVLAPVGRGPAAAPHASITSVHGLPPLAQDDGRDCSFSPIFDGQQPPADVRLPPICVGVHHSQLPAALSHCGKASSLLRTPPPPRPGCRRRDSRRRLGSRILATKGFSPLRVICQ